MLRCRLAGYFNEQPQLLASASSPTARSQLEMEAQPFKDSSGGLGLSPAQQGSIADALVGATGRADGMSSPVFRDSVPFDEALNAEGAGGGRKPSRAGALEGMAEVQDGGGGGAGGPLGDGGGSRGARMLQGM